MKILNCLKRGMAVCCLFVAAGCAPVQETGPTTADMGIKVSGIAVMPVQSALDTAEAASPAEERMLGDGTQAMNGLLRQVLAGKPGIRFVNALPKAEGKKGAVGNLEAARRIAAQQGCNTVLETTLSRYSERVGGDYGVKQSAAVTFSYRLYEVSEGRVLCHGRFDEQQQAVMDNLLTLPKAQSRGLIWLTAEELALDGLKEKMRECSYIEGR